MSWNITYVFPDRDSLMTTAPRVDDLAVKDQNHETFKTILLILVLHMIGLTFEHQHQRALPLSAEYAA